MFKNMTPKQKIIIAVVVVVIIALIVFFVVRAKKKKKQYAESAEKKVSGESQFKKSEPTPAEGGKFRVIPDEDDPENLPEEKTAPRPQQSRQEQQKPKIQQKPHLNTSGKTRGGALPPMEEDLSQIPNDESSFTGVLFNVDQVIDLSKSKKRK